MKSVILDGRSVIVGAAYVTDVAAGDMKIFEKVYDILPSIPYDKNDVINAIEGFIDKSKYNKIGQREAFVICLSRELKKVKANIDSFSFIETPEENVRHVLDSAFDALQNEIPLGKELLNYYLVERYPPPFEDKDFAIMVFDKADKVKYGINGGIYFKRQKLLPFRSALGALHELVHLAISIPIPSKLARGLEDGICDLLGSVYLGSSILPLPMCLSYLQNRRFTARPSLIAMRYLKNLQQASLFYLKHGFRGLLYVAKKGRNFIEQIEKACLLGEYDKLPTDIETGEWEKPVTKFAYKVLLFEHTLAVSPLAFLIAEYLEEGIDFRDLIRDLNLKEDEALKALNELTNSETYIVIAKDGKITCDKSKIYIKTGALRWIWPPGIRK